MEAIASYSPEEFPTWHAGIRRLWNLNAHAKTEIRGLGHSTKQFVKVADREGGML